MLLMIEEFAKRLRKALDKFLFTSCDQKQERASIGSICLSLMSFDLNDTEEISFVADLMSFDSELDSESEGQVA